LTLPVLADWLEERLGLAATAGLLRLPDPHDPPEDGDVRCHEFDYFPLGPDAFGWLVRAQLRLDPQTLDETPRLVLGLYAHPGR
jgi:hypothetical protein